MLSNELTHNIDICYVLTQRGFMAGKMVVIYLCLYQYQLGLGTLKPNYQYVVTNICITITNKLAR